MGPTSLNWAIDENSDKALEPKLQDPSLRKIMWLGIEPLLAYIASKQRLKLNRVSLAKAHFESGGWMDPSDVRGFAANTRLLVEGKNRLAAAQQLGETHAPISVPLHLVDFFIEDFQCLTGQ